MMRFVLLTVSCKRHWLGATAVGWVVPTSLFSAARSAPRSHAVRGNENYCQDSWLMRRWSICNSIRVMKANESGIFLKTIIPSRKATRKHLIDILIVTPVAARSEPWAL